jgi:hypothetical protein
VEVAMNTRKIKPTHFITETNGDRKYFFSYLDAKDYVDKFAPFMTGKKRIGIYHIYPFDKSGYTSKSDGRTSFGEGNKEWKK